MMWVLRWISSLWSSGSATPPILATPPKESSSPNDKAPSDIPDRFDASVNHIRDTAKWIVVVFGSIAAVLVGTSPFSSIGKLGFDDYRFWISVVSLGIALGATGLIIRFVISVQSAGAVSLGELAKQATEDDTALIGLNPALLKGYPSPRELWEDFNEQFRLQYEAVEKRNQAASTAANKKAIYLNRSIVSPLLLTMRYHRVARTFDAGKNHVVGYAGLIGIAIGVFFWASNPPAPPATSAVYTTPVRARVVLSDVDEVERLNGMLEDECRQTD